MQISSVKNICNNKPNLASKIKPVQSEINISNYSSQNTVSFSGTNYKALFLAGLLTLSSVGFFAGCQSQKPNVSVNTSSVQTKVEDSYSAEELQNKLYSYGDKLTIEDTIEELYKFMENNSINNVDIDDINNPKNKSRETALRMKQTVAAFWANTDENINFKSGTLYINKSVDLKDKTKRELFIAQATHEATHALQLSKDTTKQGLSDYISDKSTAENIFSFLTTDIGYYEETFSAVQIARNAAFSQYVDVNLDETERNIINENINKYQQALYDKPVVISDNVVKDGIMEYSKYMCGIEEATFEDTINHFADDAVNIFLSTVPHSPDEEENLSNALISAIIYMFRSEAEAYSVGNDALKIGINMQNQNILMDYIPKSYSMIADVLQQRLNK